MEMQWAKSMQGAGGSLVMGVVMNSIMARSAAKKILELTPEQWLTDVYHEVNSVFKSFNGTMVVSAAVVMIDDESGEMLYWNAEHPFAIPIEMRKPFHRRWTLNLENWN